ncbi:MAG TPA: choice-of-anchor tandem repeat GloVer-containing protein [Bryobacteraceae bacterium]|nr:choice-of-anchor tandem repeat GloVer-containing protein [Bryobacteraceae bacterium]
MGVSLALAAAGIVPCHAAAPVLSTIYSFTDIQDGGFPQAGLVMSSSGVLYGTTYYGGTSGWGTVFELTQGTGGKWTETTLYNFTGGTDGATPVSDLTIGTNNVLYGTAYYGGAHGYGAVFALTPPSTGTTWTEKVLYSFASGNDGAYPAAGVALSSSTGVLYGTTYQGGNEGCGTVFQVAPGKNNTWTEKVLYAFQGAADGCYPDADLAFSSSTSILYGTTSQGGEFTISPNTYPGWGTVFQLAPAGGGVWNETVLYTFTGGTDGGTPESNLIIGPGTVLYGTTFWGGNGSDCPIGGYQQGCGTIFELTPAGGGVWKQSILYAFTGANSTGTHPYRNILRESTSGTLVGTTYAGGAAINVCFPESYPGCGTAFTLKPPATGTTWTQNNLAVFLGYNGGAPNGAIMSTSGIVYGTTQMGGYSNGNGTVFQVVP